MSDYRVDQETGAVIFRKSAEAKKRQRMEQRIANLEKEVEMMKKQMRRRKWLRR